jgi:hypothetical protein
MTCRRQEADRRGAERGGPEAEAGVDARVSTAHSLAAATVGAAQVKRAITVVGTVLPGCAAGRKAARDWRPFILLWARNLVV